MTGSEVLQVSPLFSFFCRLIHRLHRSTNKIGVVGGWITTSDLEFAHMGKIVRLLVRVGPRLVSKPGEAWLLLRMAWWVLVLSVAARCYSLPRALQIVAGNKSRFKRTTTVRQEDLARAIDLLLSTDVLIFKPICWKRAAVLHRYLARNGVITRIVFGVRSESEGKVDGHAWLEADGQPILEATPPDYIITYRFPSNDRFDPELALITAD